jgi:hypothetical protein
MTRPALPALLLGPLLCVIAARAEAQASTPGSPPCRARAVSRTLVFWVGDWDVYVGKDLAGRDNVERVLDGCAVTERWDGGAGDQGMSLFGYDARKDLWVQNWITNNSALPGGIKVKVLRAHAPGTTTFQGEIEGKSGAIYYDRTILTALPGGRVHQEIQVSRDGVTWRTGFDAVYVPHGQKL